MKKRINHPSQRRATLAMDKEDKPLGPLNRISIGYLLAAFHVDPADEAKRREWKRKSSLPPKKIRTRIQSTIGTIDPRSLYPASVPRSHYHD